MGTTLPSNNIATSGSVNNSTTTNAQQKQNLGDIVQFISDYFGTDSTLLPASLKSINSGPLSGLRNAFINGSMSIDQRNNGAAKTYTAGAALSYGVDRWYGYCTGANVTGQRVAGTGNVAHRYKFTGATSVTAIGFGQRVAAENSCHLAGKTATLAVDMSNSVLTSVTWTAYYANTTDTFGALASPTRTSIATGTFTVNSTVTRYYAQIAIPSAATTGIEIVFTVGAQTSGTWVIGSADLLPVTVSETYHEPRHDELEYILCLPYYQEIGADSTGTIFVGNWATASGQPAFTTLTYQKKRSTPQVDILGSWGAVNTITGSPAVSAIGIDSVRLSITPAAAGQFYSYNSGGSARVAITCEL